MFIFSEGNGCSLLLRSLKHCLSISDCKQTEFSDKQISYFSFVFVCSTENII